MSGMAAAVSRTCRMCGPKMNAFLHSEDAVRGVGGASSVLAENHLHRFRKLAIRGEKIGRFAQEPRRRIFFRGSTEAVEMVLREN